MDGAFAVDFTLGFMIELPDKRAVIIIALVGIVFIANAVISPESALYLPSEILLYVAVISAGIAFSVFDLQEGFCINRPSINRYESPFLFWSEVVVALSFIPVGAYKLWHLW